MNQGSVVLVHILINEVPAPMFTHHTSTVIVESCTALILNMLSESLFLFDTLIVLYSSRRGVLLFPHMRGNL